MSRTATLPLIVLLLVAPWQATANEDEARATVLVARSGASVLVIPMTGDWQKIHDRNAYPLRLETSSNVRSQLRVSDRSPCVVQTRHAGADGPTQQVLAPGSETEFVADLVLVEDPCELEIRIRKDAHNAED